MVVRMHDRHPLPGEDVVVEGVRVHVVRHGRDGARHAYPPLVLLHGLPTSSFLWHDVMRDLEHDHRMIAPDLVGLGRSERPVGRWYDLAAQARLMWRALERLRARRVVLAGHDLGGAVATHMAALQPERVAALVLIDAPVHRDAWPPPAALPLVLPGIGRAYVGALARSPRLAKVALRRALPADLPVAAVDRHLDPLLCHDGARGVLALARAVDMAGVEAAWDIVRAAPPPSLVLWGEDDPVRSTAYGRRVATELPGAAWVPVPGAGALLPQERPERVAEEIDGFVAEMLAAPLSR
jgi:pimeloyl-ACP methyl ester carboxylesterase